MSVLERYVDQFGPVVGPKLIHLEKSRAAYKGVCTRRRSQIEQLTGKPMRRRRPSPARAEATPLFPEVCDEAS